jgi:hypothetical protein
MFESKINRGRANGYAPLDSGSKVPLSYLPPIAPVIDTGSFATTSSLQTLIDVTGSFVTTSSFNQYTASVTMSANIDSSSFATTGSNQFNGNQSITGSLTVSSTFIDNSNLYLTGSDLIVDSGSIRVSGSIDVSGSLIVSSTIVNNATLALTGSDLIIENGYLILTGSTIPLGLTGSINDREGTVVFDDDYLYYCVSNFIPETYQITVNQGNPYDTHVLIPKNQGIPSLYSGGWSITTSGDVTYVLTGVYSDGDNWDCEIDNLNSNYNGGTQTMTLTWLDWESTDIWKKISLNGISINSSSFATTGSNIFIGDQIISGSLVISGSTELGGNLIPQTARGATLGTIDKPFADIFVSSGSINIAGVPGDPNTTISNVGGNLLLSAGGMRLLDSASFIASTGSFGYISGSMTQVGDYNQTGNYIMVGDKTITGSLNISGDITSSATIQANKFVFEDGIVQTNSLGQKIYATDTGTLYFYSGENGITFFNEDITETIATLTNDGTFTTTNGFSGSLAGTSSYSSNSNLLDGKDSTIFATTGSNTFKGDTFISASYAKLVLNSPNLASIDFTGNQFNNYIQYDKTSNTLTTYGLDAAVNNEAWAGFRIRTGASNTSTKLFITGSSIQLSGSATISGSLSVNGLSAVTSSNVFSIQTITSASYAALTPVSGTLYIIIG